MEALYIYMGSKNHMDELDSKSVHTIWQVLKCAHRNMDMVKQPSSLTLWKQFAPLDCWQDYLQQSSHFSWYAAKSSKIFSLLAVKFSSSSKLLF